MKGGLRVLGVLLVFAVFVGKGWGQTGGTTVRVIPQIAVGSFDGGLTTYSTIVQIINANAISVAITGNFFNEDGSPANFGFAVGSQVTVVNGAFSGVILDPNKVLVLIIAAPSPSAVASSPGVLGWARITTTAPVTFSTVYELRETRANSLISRVGVPTSPTNMAKFVTPRVRNVATGLDTGFALVNTAPSLTAITVMLKDAAGATIATRNLTMAGSSHRSLFASEFFGLTNEPAGVAFQYILFDAGNAAQFAATALAIEGTDQTSLPVDVLR